MKLQEQLNEPSNTQLNWNATPLSQGDHQYVWHPYWQHGLEMPILPVASAKGAYLTLESGEKVLDAISSWWVNLHGHAHPVLAHTLSQQALQLEHVIFSGFTHRPAVELAQTLLEYPEFKQRKLSRAFYSDNGSTAVEAALKMAFQYHHNQGEMRRTRFLALRNAYHGDTLGAMAVGEPTGFHAQFRRLMPAVDFIDPTDKSQWITLFEKHGHEYAAFIYEPLIQAAAGMKWVDLKFLEEVLDHCQRFGILTICDEIFTGFYRTGKCFALEYSNQIRPDFICLSKGLTGGFLPLAMTLTTEAVFEKFTSTEMRQAFLHGHSYTANPIACAVALASWQILHSDACQKQIQQIAEVTAAEISALNGHPFVRSARYLGTIGAVELETEMNYFSSGKTTPLRPGMLLQLALKRGVLLRPLGNVLHAVPPYCCTVGEIKRIYRTLREVMEEAMNG
jgi:adenosylmethionine-8-amino-7-oxononanoate aminotransferase